MPVGLACLALLCGAPGAFGQTLDFDQPLLVSKFMPPLHHPPVDAVCPLGLNQMVELRYWQKNPEKDGVVYRPLRPGQVFSPACGDAWPPLHLQPLIVTCSAYPGFVVKARYTVGEEGQHVAVLPRRPGQAALPCDDKTAPGEFDLAGGSGFWGVAGKYVFLAAPDPDLFFILNVSAADAPQRSITVNVADVPGSGLPVQPAKLVRLPNGFDFYFEAVQSEQCAVGSGAGLACLARLEHAAGTKMAFAKCLLGEQRNDPNAPVSIEYPALLSARGNHLMLRATGPGIACIAAE